MKNILSILVLTMMACTVFSAPQHNFYEVPVKDPGLQLSRFFTLTDVTFTQNKNNIEINFAIPQELTGKENRIKFTGVIGQTCHLSKGQAVSCKMTYPGGISFDQSKVTDLLAKKFSGDELLKRIDVQKKFSTDPVGIIHINLKPARKSQVKTK